MRSSRSCGGRLSATASQPCISVCACSKAGLGNCGADSSAPRQVTARPSPRAACDSHSRSSSLAPNSGLFRARANDRSCPGEASTSSTASRSSASGDSCSARCSATTCGTSCWASASATRPSVARLRASTMMSPGFKPAWWMRSATAAATCPASAARRCSSASLRAWVSESRQTPSAEVFAARAGRITPGKRQTEPWAAESVVWAR